MSHCPKEFSLLLLSHRFFSVTSKQSLDFPALDSDGYSAQVLTLCWLHCDHCLELEALSPVCALSTLSLFKGPLWACLHGPTQMLKGGLEGRLSRVSTRLTQVHASNRCLGAAPAGPLEGREWRELGAQGCLGRRPGWGTPGWGLWEPCHVGGASLPWLWGQSGPTQVIHARGKKTIWKPRHGKITS